MANSDTRDEPDDERPSEPDDDSVDWFATSALRAGLTLLGLVLLLFALGQAVGVDLLGMIGDALATRVGRWLVVAFFALLLIVVAMRGFGTRSG